MAYLCEHCSKHFARESTLTSHLCEPKRRWQDRNTVSVQLALEVYRRFYQHCQPSHKLKTWEQFANSNYYSAFVRFSQYMLDVKCVNTGGFINYVIQKNIKLDQWASDRVYTDFLIHWTRNEDAWDAVKRSIETASDWANEANSHPAHYFLYANHSRIMADLDRGRVTAWFVLGTQSGQTWLTALKPEQLDLIYRWIDPEYWGKKLLQNSATAEIQNTLEQAGF
jgi:hypothetical protein